MPAGQYGKEALTSLGLWTALAPSVIQTEDVRAALGVVRAGEAGYGIVYASDAKDQPVTIVAELLAQSHKPIRYPAAAEVPVSPAAQSFLAFLATPVELAHFTAAGFTLP